MICKLFVLTYQTTVKSSDFVLTCFNLGFNYEKLAEKLGFETDRWRVSPNYFQMTAFAEMKDSTISTSI